MDKEQLEVDVDAVVESFQSQLSDATRSMAIKDGMIAQLLKERAELRQTIDRLAPGAEGDES